MKTMENPWHYEDAAGNITVCGADEAGAGPLAGPVYAAAVILPRGIEIPGLHDSKQCSPKKREELYEKILETALAYSVYWVSPEDIDQWNILNARIHAMDQAILNLSIPADYALVDGNRDRGSMFEISIPHKCIVGGDGKSASIAAASILAKVSRDRYMTEVLDRDYPQYQFARHKGYGTKLHYEMLDKYGPCVHHRMSFLKTWEGRDTETG
jgi:ribonuclease HII